MAQSKSKSKARTTGVGSSAGPGRLGAVHPSEVINSPLTPVTQAQALQAEQDRQVALARNAAPLATLNR